MNNTKCIKYAQLFITIALAVSIIFTLWVDYEKMQLNQQYEQSLKQKNEQIELWKELNSQQAQLNKSQEEKLKNFSEFTVRIQLQVQNCLHLPE